MLDCEMDLHNFSAKNYYKNIRSLTMHEKMKIIEFLIPSLFNTLSNKNPKFSSDIV